MRKVAALALVLLAVAALSGGALMLSDGLLTRGLVTMAAAFGPAFSLRQMYRPDRPRSPRFVGGSSDCVADGLGRTSESRR